LGPAIEENQYHISIIKSQLTRNLATIFPSLHNEIRAAFDDDDDVTVRGQGTHFVNNSMSAS